MLTLESQRQYVVAGDEHHVRRDRGGPRRRERMEEFNRRMTSAKAWGIDARLLTPAEIKELVPFVNEDVVLGGFYTPSVSVVDSLQSGTLMRDEAVAKGALQVFANTEVLDIEVDTVNGRLTVRAVVTDKGRIECEHVAIACGVWSPRIAAMAGATIPLTPAVHQMADVGPIDILQESGKEVAYPIVRDMDTFCYERQSAGSMEVGSYAHRPIFHHPDDIPSNEESALSPTELPFTADDFDPQLEEALELMGEILETAEIRYAINGLLSLTPDAMPVLGETVEVANLWCAAAVWIKEGPGIAQLVAEWMTYGYPHLCDPHTSDISRFYPHERTEHHIYARCAEHYNKTYGIVHPREQWAQRAGHAPQPVLRPRGGARRGVLRRPRLGAPAVVREQRRAVRQVPAGERGHDRTSGTPGGGRRSPTPSTWRCATASAWSTSPRSTSSTSRARAPSMRCSTSSSTTSTSPVGQVGLHAAADAGRRVPR